MNKKIKKSIISLGVVGCVLGFTTTNAFAAITRESSARWIGDKAQVTCKTGRNYTGNVSMIRAMAEMNIRVGGGTETGPNAIIYSPSPTAKADGSFTTKNTCQDGYTYHSYSIAGETGEYTVRVVTQ